MPYSKTGIQELRTRRRKLGEDMRAIHDQAREEKRELSADETEKFDKMYEDSEKLRAEIEREEKLSGFQAEPEPARRTAVDPAAEPTPELEPEKRADADRESDRARNGEEYRALFGRYLTAGSAQEATAVAIRAQEFLAEHRDLQVDSDAQAGFLVAPEQMVMELLKNVDDQVKVRQWARKFMVQGAKSLGVPTRTAKAASFAWGTELQTPTADTALAYGKRELYPKDASGEIKVSRNFLRQSFMSGEQIVREEIARDGAELQENAFLTGSGSGQPLGVFTASADGIPTTQDISTGNTSSAITVQGLREAKYAIKTNYWPFLRWLAGRTFHKQVGLSDGIGRPLFVESLRVGEPDRLMGFPLELSEFAPSTWTTGQYVGILGDFRYYWIVDSLDLEIQRLDELYARSHQVGFIARMKLDGAPVLAEAFARVKLG